MKTVKVGWLSVFVSAVCGTACMLAQATATAANESSMPRLGLSRGASVLTVNGGMFLGLGGELGNSSAGTVEQADAVLPKLARMHVNLVLMPVSWDQTEPREGKYDFRILDHWIEVAGAQKIHLGLLWFGSWKNGYSNYAPDWVKRDGRRFPRARDAGGIQTEILSTFGAETQAKDMQAFRALMRHVRERDGGKHTVLMVQVENEVGFLGQGRDRSAPANAAFAAEVPKELMRSLMEHRATLSPELAAHFDGTGKSWREVFGDAADEVFMAWYYARYIQSVAEAGKQEYALPMYTNAQLPAALERAGEYPSGGPHPSYPDVYLAAGKAIDMYSPDIYWPDFAYWIKRYQRDENPLFVPEAQLEQGAYNALYAIGEMRAFGFCPFGIDSVPMTNEGTESDPPVMQVYGELDAMKDMILRAQHENRTRALVLHSTSARSHQGVALGGYLFDASLLRSWPSNDLASKDGAVLLLESAPDEFYVIGSGLSVKVARDADTDEDVAGIASVEQVRRTETGWGVVRRLNGDQSNQGRQLDTDAHQFRTYRVRLYHAAR